MAGVTPQQIYQALLSAGASTVQAIGIMANMINESSLNPEAKNPSDPNGGSFGLVQQNGTQYASLVTGNPAADMLAQIKVIAQNGGFAAANGATGAQAAGNFAANYERCVGCQSGGAQYSSRVANAATVANWVSSGNWPTSAGSASTQAGTSATAATDPSCLIGWSGVGGTSWITTITTLGASSGNVGEFCLVKRSEARAVIGAGLMVMSAGAFLVGALILAAAGFQKTGGLSKAADVAAVVPGGEGVAAGLMVAHARANRSGSSAAASRRRSSSSKPTASSAAASRRRSSSSKPTASSSSTPAAKTELSQADRAAMRARADQVSTRIEPAS